MKYEFWEYKGVFYFGKEDFWLDKPVKWYYDKGKPLPEDNTFNIDDATYITTFGVPNCRRSEDAKDVTATVSLSVEREQTETQLAPGDPVYFYGIPTWENKYLITSMESDLLEPTSVVSVQLGTIIKKKKKSQAGGGSGGTSYEEIFPAPCGYNLGAGDQFALETGTVPAYPWSADGRWVLGKEAGDFSQCSRSADIQSAIDRWRGTVANSSADVGYLVMELISHPFRLRPNSTVYTVDQNSDADAQQVAMILLTKIGERQAVQGLASPTTLSLCLT